VLLDATAPDDLGDHPWNTLPPLVLDTSAGDPYFQPFFDYAREDAWLDGRS
jgi:hypothetical protein